MNDRLPGTTYDNPIWYKGYRIYLSTGAAFSCGGYEYEYVHDNYDGAEDAGDSRYGYTMTIDEAKAEIDEREDG